MARCWELRGCDKEMRDRCPHAIELEDRCPVACAYAACHSDRHELATNPELVFSMDVDRSQAIKEECRFCVYFLTNGPRSSR